MILILDFGGQYCHLIARRIRELGVYSEIVPGGVSIDEIKAKQCKGIILSGGPSSVYEKGSPQLPEGFFDYTSANKIPILGICYGLHLIIHSLGGLIESHQKKEYGKMELKITKANPLFEGLNETEIVWMSHADQIKELPKDFESIAMTNTCPIAAFVNEKLQVYGVQFHPEVNHTVKGKQILENFLFTIVKAKKEWKLENWIEKKIDEIRTEVGENQVILGLSGGVDSSVAAILLHKAIGNKLHSIFVNNGLLRKNEENDVQKQFKEKLQFENFHYVDAQDLFLTRLKNVDDPEEKRKIIGHTFIEVFENKTVDLSSKFSPIKFLAQGTIYPDRVETAATSQTASKIKSHHNLTLPKNMKLEIIEPLKDLYKDEVRKIGLKLGLDPELIERHPFPGPGLAVRCLGPIDKEKLDLVRNADCILLEEITKAGIYNDLWQAFCVLLPVKTVGVMGDYRTYEYICSIRAVKSLDAMTADFAKLDWDLLEKIGSRIINEVKGINRVVYDISHKPPSTIEYE